MDVADELAKLTEISAQIEAVVIALQTGEVVGSTIANEDRAASGPARSAARTLARAGRPAKGTLDQGLPVQLEAVLPDASVFVVREGDRLIAAVTGPDPAVGLVFYDLKSCLAQHVHRGRPGRRGADRGRLRSRRQGPPSVAEEAAPAQAGRGDRCGGG